MNLVCNVSYKDANFACKLETAVRSVRSQLTFIFSPIVEPERYDEVIQILNLILAVVTYQILCIQSYNNSCGGDLRGRGDTCFPRKNIER